MDALIIATMVLVTIINVAISREAYRNGVRDGYQHTSYPHVREQVQQEGLVQGEEVPLP